MAHGVERTAAAPVVPIGSAVAVVGDKLADSVTMAVVGVIGMLALVAFMELAVVTVHMVAAIMTNIPATTIRTIGAAAVELLVVCGKFTDD